MVPFVDLRAQHEHLREEIHAAIDRILESCRFALGEEVAAFEHEFAAYCRTDHAIAVNSGTSALHLALLAAGIGPGDEVITTPMTFVATVAAIRYTGARPVLVDIDPVRYTLDPTRIEAAITGATRAIIPVHLYGQPADMDPILDIAEPHGLTVIEDAAQAHGAEYKGRRAGGLGRLGCFSFYPAKNLGACGEGGCVVTNEAELAQKVRMMRDWGQKARYEHVLPGFNYRLDAIQGAVLRAKLRHLEQWTEDRQRHAAHYSERLGIDGIAVPAVSPDVRHVFHVYAIRTSQPDVLRAALERRQVQSSRHYPAPIHLLTAHRDLGYGPGDFPVSEQLAREELSLPMFAELTGEQIELVVSAIRESLA